MEPVKSLHKKPGCNGKWINISTLAARQSTCVECRAVVNCTPEDIEQMLSQVDEEPPVEPRRFIPWRIVVWCVAMLTFAILYNSCHGGK